jgi:hypothetical protein
MKSNLLQVATYKKTIKSFKDFYELKCNLPGLITEEDIEVRNDLYPEGVEVIYAIPFEHSFKIAIHVDTDFGYNIVTVEINLKDGQNEISFESAIFAHKTNKFGLLSFLDFKILVTKYYPLIEKFLDTLDKLERNKPCENDCYYREQRKKDGVCDKMYISKSEYTPEKNALAQQITLVREQMNKK